LLFLINLQKLRGTMTTNNTKGFVYIIQEEFTGHVKIGVSTNIGQRLRNLQTANSGKLKVIGIKASNDPYTLEHELHQKFKDYRIQGEWFSHLPEPKLSQQEIAEYLGFDTSGLAVKILEKANAEEEANIFSKPSSLIAGNSNLTLPQLHTFNMLLANVYANIVKGEVDHSMPVVDFIKKTATTNRGRIKQNLEALTCKHSTLNLLKGTTTESFSFLESANIKNGLINYNFSRALINVVLDKTNSFAPIDLEIQKKYRGSAYGWLLYEICADNLKSRIFKISLSTLKHAFGIKDDQYYEYKGFNQRVLSKAVKAVNNNTPFRLDYTSSRVGRKINSIVFNLVQNKQRRSVGLQK
jgi:hypothetical protein